MAQPTETPSGPWAIVVLAGTIVTAIAAIYAMAARVAGSVVEIFTRDLRADVESLKVTRTSAIARDVAIDARFEKLDGRFDSQDKALQQLTIETAKQTTKLDTLLGFHRAEQ